MHFLSVAAAFCLVFCFDLLVNSRIIQLVKD